MTADRHRLAPTTQDSPHIRKAGLWWMENGRVLLCRTRKNGGLLILPGGKLEGDETPEQALLRELAEELGGVTASDPQLLGEYEAAAIPDGATIRIWLYSAAVTGTPVPHSEVRELVWFDPARDDWSRLAPSIRNPILPDLIRRGLVAAGEHRE